MRRQSTKSRNSARNNVLHARVWSTRLLRIGLFKVLFRCIKPGCVLAILAGLGWGVQLGLQRAFYDNPDFRLQVVDLNPNPALDELDFVRITGLDLRTNLFRIDRKAIARRLTSLPELADAQVERRLPGTLVVRVSARTPRAWLACPAAGQPAARQAGGMLVDSHDIAYPCPARQLAAAEALAIIELPARDKQPIVMGQKVQQPELQRCLRLLASTNDGDPDGPPWIDSVKQANAWSLALTTRAGTVATVGLGDHARQVANLRSALQHAANKGYAIATINLIPKENVPITVIGAGSSDASPPRAIPVAEPTAQAERPDRHTRDLKALLGRE
jgi:hypothetical protein